MPELPEVEQYKRYLEAAVIGQKITSIDQFNSGRILRSPIDQFESGLVGYMFLSVERIGKYLFLKTNGPKLLNMHFGLTGSVAYLQAEIEMPRFTRVVFDFENGFRLAYMSLRKFGRLELIDSVDSFQKEKKLGVDALIISETDFIESMQKKKSPVKAALLQQNKIAGIGNWIADEMLFQAQIHPEEVANVIPSERYRILYKELQKILEVAIRLESDYDKFPSHFLVNKRTDGESCPRCGDKIIRIEVGGRGTYICQSCQTA